MQATGLGPESRAPANPRACGSRRIRSAPDFHNGRRISMRQRFHAPDCLCSRCLVRTSRWIGEIDPLAIAPPQIRRVAGARRVHNIHAALAIVSSTIVSVLRIRTQNVKLHMMLSKSRTKTRNEWVLGSCSESHAEQLLLRLCDQRIIVGGVRLLIGAATRRSLFLVLLLLLFLAAAIDRIVANVILRFLGEVAMARRSGRRAHRPRGGRGLRPSVRRRRRGGVGG